MAPKKIASSFLRSSIAESGSVGDYINSIMSLNTRQILEIYPGHGNISVNPGEDMRAAVENARQFLSRDEKIKITYDKDINNIQVSN